MHKKVKVGKYFFGGEIQFWVRKIMLPSANGVHVVILCVKKDNYVQSPCLCPALVPAADWGGGGKSREKESHESARVFICTTKSGAQCHSGPR